MNVLPRLENTGKRLTDREAFISAFQEARRNIPYFVAMAAGAAILPDLFGIVGKIVTAALALLFAVSVFQALLSTVMGLAILTAWPFLGPEDRHDLKPGWASLSVVVTTVNVVVYAASLYLIGRTSSWWGLL